MNVERKGAMVHITMTELEYTVLRDAVGDGFAHMTSLHTPRTALAETVAKAYQTIRDRLVNVS